MPRAALRLGMTLAADKGGASRSRGHDKGRLAKFFYLRKMPFGVTAAARMV
jgi:hypothetical protein